MIGYNVQAQITQGKANEDYSAPKRCPVGVHFVSEYLVRLGQANDPFDMDSLGGNLPVLENYVGRQLRSAFHGGRSVNLHVLGRKQILDLQPL